jgi:hypothetical protein
MEELWKLRELRKTRELWELGISTWNDGSITKFNNQPSLIVLCTWTGAENRHIHSYQKKYQEKFPSTPGILIKTTIVDLCIRDSKSKQKRLQPAVEWIAKRLQNSPIAEQILMHVFSEGGSNKACELAEAYLTEKEFRLPVSALILDSTPGLPHFRRLCNAASRSISPIPCTRVVSLLLSYVAVGTIWVAYRGIKGFENNIISMTRERLLNDRMWDLNAPRCYVYSEKDALVAPEDVEAHAISIKYSGTIILQKFDKSKHVNHARSYETAYWDAVWYTWEINIPLCAAKNPVAQKQSTTVQSY